MKRICFLISFICISIRVMSQSPSEKIGDLINKQEYFKLKRELENTTIEKVNPIIWHMAKAFVGTYFNQPEDAKKSIGVLLEQYQNEIGVENTLAMLNLLIEDYANMHEYDIASKLCNNLANQFSANKELSDSFKSAWRLYAGLAKVPKQKVEVSNAVIKFERDDAGLVTLPVEDNKGKKHRFVLDTGAGYSIIPESRTLGFNIRIVTDSVFVVGGIAGTWSKMGYAESITIGNMHADNVLFHILPDSVLSVQYKGENVYSLNGIIGWDFIRDFDNIVLNNKNKTLAFNSSNEPSQEKCNLMVSSLHPYVEAISGADTLVLDVDMGTNVSILTNRYLQKHRNDLLLGNVKVNKEGGIGGVGEQKVYTLSDFPITIGQTSTIPSIDVTADEDLYYIQKLPVAVDGILGQNIIKQYDLMIIDLSKMSVNLKYKK